MKKTIMMINDVQSPGAVCFCCQYIYVDNTLTFYICTLLHYIQRDPLSFGIGRRLLTNLMFILFCCNANGFTIEA